jgi:hypothetical protein
MVRAAMTLLVKRGFIPIETDGDAYDPKCLHYATEVDLVCHMRGNPRKRILFEIKTGYANVLDYTMQKYRLRYNRTLLGSRVTSEQGRHFLQLLATRILYEKRHPDLARDLEAYLLNVRRDGVEITPIPEQVLALRPQLEELLAA